MPIWKEQTSYLAMIQKIGRKSLYLTITLIASSLISGCQQNSNAQAVFSQRASETEINLEKISADQFSQEQLDKAKELVELGLEKGERGNLKAALSYTEQAIRIFPGYARAYYNRGVAREQFGDTQGALADYTKAIELYPDTISPPRILSLAYGNRGALLHQLGDELGAIADANEVLKLQPNRAGAYANRGLAYLGLKNYEAAIADQSRAIELQPTVPGWYFNRGKAHRLAGNYQEALRDLDQAISINPRFSWAYVQRGHTQEELNNLQQAEADYTKALNLGYKKRLVYSSRAEVRSKSRKYSLALADYNRVISDGSNRPGDYHSRSIAHHNLGDFASAQQDAVKAAELYLAQGDKTQHQALILYAQQKLPY